MRKTKRVAENAPQTTCSNPERSPSSCILGHSFGLMRLLSLHFGRVGRRGAHPALVGLRTRARGAAFFAREPVTPLGILRRQVFTARSLSLQFARDLYSELRQVLLAEIRVPFVNQYRHGRLPRHAGRAAGPSASLKR